LFVPVLLYLQAVQEIESGGVRTTSQVTSEFYDFPQARLVPVCSAGTVAYPGDGIWCYRHHPLAEAKSFWDAEAACQSEGGHLASAASREENMFLAQLARKAGTGNAGAEGGGGVESVAWIGLYQTANASEFRWTDESEVVWSFFMRGMPLHGAGSATHDSGAGIGGNGTCAYIGAGDWWKSECSYTVGKLCGGRAWGPWGGQWGDVVALAEEEDVGCFGHPTTSMIPASEACYQPHWVGCPCKQQAATPLNPTL